MRKKIKLGKISAVIFLTILIWVWADLRQDATYTVVDATISAAKPADLWVRLSQEEDYVTIDEVVFKGPLSNINALKQKELNGTFQAKFLYNPQKEKAVSPGERKIIVARFIEDQDEVKDLGISVERCSPSEITVNIVPLVSRSCRIECIDAYRGVLNQAKVEPPEINMPVPSNWSGDSLKATVQLGNSDVIQAQNEGVRKKPYIELPDKQKRIANEDVEVKLPLQVDNMRQYTVQAVLYIALSSNLIGKYDVKVSNTTELSTVYILATQAAYEAYRDQANMPDQAVPQITLYVLDSDRDREPPLRRKVEYNFPQKYVENSEIRISTPLSPAQFELVRLPVAENTK